MPAALEQEEENPAEPAEWMWLQRANADGTIPPTAYQEALAQTRKIEANTRSGSPQLSDVQWRLLGPSNIGGRLIDLVLHPTTPGTVYVAAGTGGVWKSTDGGATLTSAWSDDLPQSMGALAIAPDGTLYAGTGEPDHGGGGSYYGTGIYRSTDGGATWTSLGLTNTGAIGRIRIDPDQSAADLRGRAGAAVRHRRRPRRVPVGERRGDLAAGARRTEQLDRRDRPRHQPHQPGHHPRGDVGQAAVPGRA